MNVFPCGPQRVVSALSVMHVKAPLQVQILAVTPKNNPGCKKGTY